MADAEARAWDACLPQTLTSLKIDVRTTWQWESLRQLQSLVTLALTTYQPTLPLLPISLTSLTLAGVDVPVHDIDSQV